MVELKYRNWNEININTFQKLQNVLAMEKMGDDVIDGINQNISILSILCDVEEDVISNLTGKEYNQLLSEIEFLNELPKVKIKDSYVINNKKYDVALNIDKLTMAQYIDFQTFCKDKDKYMKELLTCFLIPKGKKYGEGYNLNDVKNDIGEHLSIVDAHSMMFFFILSFQTLTKTTLHYFVKKMKKQMKTMTVEQRAKTEEVITMLKNLTLSM